MAKNIEAQGKRVGYIVGGIVALLLAAILVILYFPVFLQDAFGIAPIWDLRPAIEGLIGANILSLIDEWGIIGILTGFMLLYFICFCARPSGSSTLFRFVSILGCLGLLLPELAILIMSFVEGLDLTPYIGYAILGIWALSFILYIWGIINRAVKKYHKNRASTLLVFTATFWFVIFTVFALTTASEAFGLGLDFLLPITAILTIHLLSVIAIYLVIASIWAFITIPHRIRVEYNTDTSTAGRPIVANVTPTTQQAPATPPTQNAQEMTQPTNARFAHNYTSASNEVVQPAEQTPLPNTQPLNAYPQRPVVQQVQPQSFAQPIQQPMQTQPTQNAFVQPQQRPINGFNQPQNFAQTPQNLNPARPAQGNVANPFGQPARPLQPNNFNQPQRPMQPTQQAPRPMQPQNPFARPAQPTQTQPNPFAQPRPTQPIQPQNRPPVTPFTRPMQQPNYTQPPRPAGFPQQPPFNNPQQPNAPRPMGQPNQPFNPYGTPPKPNNNGTNGNTGNI